MKIIEILSVNSLSNDIFLININLLLSNKYKFIKNNKFLKKNWKIKIKNFLFVIKIMNIIIHNYIILYKVNIINYIQSNFFKQNIISRRWSQ